MNTLRTIIVEDEQPARELVKAYLKSHEQLAAYETAVKASQRAVDTATIQYQAGQIQFNTLLSTLTDNAQQQDVYAATQGSVNTNLVQVYLSLGGGWEIRGTRDPVDLLPATTKDEMKQRTDYWNGLLR